MPSLALLSHTDTHAAAYSPLAAKATWSFPRGFPPQGPGICFSLLWTLFISCCFQEAGRGKPGSLKAGGRGKGLAEAFTDEKENA